MSLNLSTSQAMDNLVQGISVLKHTYPAPVSFQEKLYVFYNGSGNDGIWYTVFDGTSWAPMVSVRQLVPSLSVYPGTSPSAVVYRGLLYLFYNGSGRDGTYYTTFDGSKWNSSITSVAQAAGGQGFLPETSPAATVYGGKLQLFWSGSGRDGIWFTTFDSKVWAAQTSLNSLVKNIGIRDSTSPAVCTVDKYLYVFYQGSGHDGTFFTRLGKQGAWDAIVSVNQLIPSGMNYGDGTSPAATPLVVGGPWILLVWNGLHDGDGLWYSIISTDGTGTAQVSLKDAIGAEPVLNGSNAGVGMWNNVPFVFWPNPRQRMFFTEGQSLGI
ncbi:hypothetical protein EXIGLDRAFT_720325 [Exidia glandulosa HHB12029]|uniref:Fucose-specific lectin n=1 Tax=Exidia glandulosa HHB12029 TaxID=1314781 RepID=A0A165GG45_EXIGL|nr:hypothetical protein EXIGLDRAFT_720325 [Exidia glandulosa HHB12029]